MKRMIRVGDRVRNKTSGKCGYVANISTDNKKISVLTATRSYAFWAAKNVELFNDETE